MLDRLKRKFSTAARVRPQARNPRQGRQQIGIVSIGSCDGAVREAIDVLARQKIAVDYMRVKAFPFGHEVETFLSRMPPSSWSSRIATRSCARS